MSEGTVYLGPVPTQHLSEFTEEICDAAVDDVFDIVAWIDDIPHEHFMVDERYSFTTMGAGRYITTTCVILDGTMVGNYPNLFEGGPRWFARLLLKVVQVASVPPLRGVL